ncbi:hypothetical protein JZ751_029242 [Albula glossodonta]|uniref:Uncharacterized protein n=1 Tax=Albula glossodonta TaxID=121402 RepID=A0A8T2P8Q8_9TELE|nr:hypothetical protein JZ751_029242 [Albula glossodonta]
MPIRASRYCSPVPPSGYYVHNAPQLDLRDRNSQHGSLPAWLYHRRPRQESSSGSGWLWVDVLEKALLSILGSSESRIPAHLGRKRGRLQCAGDERLLLWESGTAP